VTGRLDQVDLDTDLILIVLDREGEPLGLSELHGKIDAVDVDPFVFDEAFPGGTDEFVRGCRMLKKVGQIEKSEDHLVSLTDAGGLMAEHLEDALTADQSHALEHAGVVR